MLRPALLLFLAVGWFHFVLPKATYPQGETTSAIVGQVRDGSGAVVAGAKVTIVDRETGVRRPMNRAGLTFHSSSRARIQ
jgi:hypothetical protein